MVLSLQISGKTFQTFFTDFDAESPPKDSFQSPMISVGFPLAGGRYVSRTPLAFSLTAQINYFPIRIITVGQALLPVPAQTESLPVVA